VPITPANLNLKIVTGIIFGPIIFRAQDETGGPIDLTNWKAFAEVRKKPDASLVLDLDPEITDPPNGEITIPKMTDEQTYDMKSGSYGWDLILEDPGGDRRGPYIAGSFIIADPITKPPEGI
jgi:hypothetical protein